MLNWVKTTYQKVIAFFKRHWKKIIIGTAGTAIAATFLLPEITNNSGIKSGQMEIKSGQVEIK